MTDVRHPSPQADPVVSYGLVALSLAMQAKAGRLTGRTAREAGDRLVAEAARLLPCDDRAAEAAGAFAGEVVTDPAQAGAALHDFIVGWQARLRPDAATHYAWQDRKDCGHD